MLTVSLSFALLVGSCQGFAVRPAVVKTHVSRHATDVDDLDQQGARRWPAVTDSSETWSFNRRDALASSAALLSLPLLKELIPPMEITTGGLSAEAMAALETGDSIVRNLWLGRLAYPTLIVALEAGLFEALKDKSLSKDQLGIRITPVLRGDGRAMEALVSVLVSLGLLHVDQGHVKLTEPARMVLLKESPHFWGSQLLAADGVTASLRRTVKQESINAPLPKNSAYAEHSDAVVDSFIESMQAHSSVTAEATAVALDNVIGASSPLPAKHVLDMAGGSGCFATALVKRHSNLRVTLSDLPPVVNRWNRKNNLKFGSSSRIDAVAADLFDASTWPKGADVVLLANVLHDWGECQADDILSAAHKTLVPQSGRIVLVEQLVQEDRTGPLPAALASVSMLLGDWRSGKQYSFAELKALLTKAGFQRVELGPKCGGFHHAVIATA